MIRVVVEASSVDRVDPVLTPSQAGRPSPGALTRLSDRLRKPVVIPSSLHPRRRRAHAHDPDHRGPPRAVTAPRDGAKPADGLRHIGPLVRERMAWLRLAAALRAEGIDIAAQEHRPLAEATRRWGEELVALRAERRP